MCGQLIKPPSCFQLAARAGMAPGFVCPVEVTIPLQRGLGYSGSFHQLPVPALRSALLRRVNHTGSDVRISTGTLMNPKAYPSQSVVASWWKWNKVFFFTGGTNRITPTAWNLGQWFMP